MQLIGERHDGPANMWRVCGAKFRSVGCDGVAVPGISGMLLRASVAPCGLRNVATQHRAMILSGGNGLAFFAIVMHLQRDYQRDKAQAKSNRFSGCISHALLLICKGK